MSVLMRTTTYVSKEICENDLSIILDNPTYPEGCDDIIV